MISPVYLSVLLVIFLFSQLAEKNPKAIRVHNDIYSVRPDPGAATILSIILVVVAGLRYGVGTDYWSYYRWQVLDWDKVVINLISFQEGGFSFLAKLSRLILNDPQTVIFLSSVITVSLYCLVIYRNSPMYTVSMLLYLFMGEWQGGFNGIRQYIAAAILFAGHRYILKREWQKYIVVILFAALFHTTAVVMLIPYFLLTRKPDVTQLILLGAGAIVIRFSYDLIFRLIGEYKGQTINLSENAYLTRSVNVFRVLVAFVPVIIYLLFCRKDGHTTEQEFYVNATFFNAFSMLAGMGSAYLSRIGIYTNATVLLGYCHLFNLIDDDKTRRATIYSVLVMYLLFWLYSLSINGGEFRWIFER